MEKKNSVQVERNSKMDDSCDPLIDPNLLYFLQLVPHSPLWTHNLQSELLSEFHGHILTFATKCGSNYHTNSFRLVSIHGKHSIELRRWLQMHCHYNRLPFTTDTKKIPKKKNYKVKTHTMHRTKARHCSQLFEVRCINTQQRCEPVSSNQFALSSLRAIKTPCELKRIQKACDLSCVAIRHMVSRASSYKSTTAMRNSGMKVLQKRLRYTSDDDNDTTAYTTILTLNGHGKHVSRQGLERVHPSFEHHLFDHTAHPVVLLDMGARYGGYCADITRTFATTTPTARQRDVYRSVLTLYELGESMVKPGVLYADIDRAVNSQLRLELRRLGYSDYTNTKKYMPHSLGHSVGLEVHDTPCITSVGPLRPNMVLTIEPGIYTDDLDIRIENTIVVTATGCRVLSDKVPWNMRWFDKARHDE